ncbi:hypothetical protein [Nocardiopsis lucentensis]|uniref:hypothetical protein n=1 Tax=Nocardiopsis lucentensis TaxID=53441 RepID=UPI00034A7E6A|nr:hypothetical protein [Nocardiopsis lucentensis]
MLHLIAALLAPVVGSVQGLLASPRGRHAARRHRSTRVRRYAPPPAPAPTPEPVSTSASVAQRPRRTTAPAPRLAPPSRHVPADDVALVRPYYAAHERDRARTSASTAKNPAPRIPQPRVPEGDLLAPPLSPSPGEFDELAALVRTWQQRQDRRGNREGVTVA